MQGRKKKLTKKQLFLLNNLKRVNNELSTLFNRERALRGAGDDPRRNLAEECGHPDQVTTQMCWDQFRRNGIAARVVNIFPDECWAVDPDIYESESSRNTPFENDWLDLCQSPDLNPLHYMHRVDCLSGIGRYGALLLGVNDGKSLDQPLDGADDREGKRPQRRDLLYLRAFDETQATVAELEDDPTSPRCGLPRFYTMRFLDRGLADTASSETTIDEEVHWSRVIHVAIDDRETSEVYGPQRLHRNYNRILDVEKVLGPSAEMYYKGGFPGISVEMDPRIAQIMNVEIDDDEIEEELFNYMNGLQRYLWLQGLNAKSLAPQVSDPRPAVEALLNSIAMSIGAPLRIFMGSEQAQLASGQDIRTWNRRLNQRQTKKLSPLLVRPLVDRLIKVGCLAPPRKFNRQARSWAFNVFWPEINMPTQDEVSQIADRRSAAMMKYIQSGAYQIMQPSDFFRHILGFTARETASIMKKTKRTPEVKVKPPTPTGDSGSRGKSPSKANPKPRAGGKSKP